ncbi:hypothetical protein QFZ32_006312 [Streptomyces canus]|nr:hypothetical protein [Streptomyces canus]
MGGEVEDALTLIHTTSRGCPRAVSNLFAGFASYQQEGMPRAEHVLGLFESARPEDPRPRQAIEQARVWVRGEVRMMQARAAGGHAMGAARDLRGAARHAAYAAGQAAVVAHVAAHELGAAAYAIKAARAAAPKDESEAAGRLECQWQRDQLPRAIRELVLDDQRLRNDICWSVFDC